MIIEGVGFVGVDVLVLVLWLVLVLVLVRVAGPLHFRQDDAEHLNLTTQLDPARPSLAKAIQRSRIK